MRHLWEHLPSGIKHTLDALSIATLFGSLISMLPAVASLLTIVWTVIRIFETTTVQGLLKRRKENASD